MNSYGARVFLIKNLKISEIENVVLCEFSDLELDLIPDIGGKWDILPPRADTSAVVTTAKKKD